MVHNAGPSIKNASQSSAGTNGFVLPVPEPSPNGSHSSMLLAPPPSQSIVAKLLNGFAITSAHKSRFPAITASQSSSEAREGLFPARHSVKLSIPPPSQSREANG